MPLFGWEFIEKFEISAVLAMIKSNKDNIHSTHKNSAKSPAAAMMQSPLAYFVRMFHRVLKLPKSASPAKDGIE